MEMKVRAVESVEEKSMQEVEKELLDKHEEKLIEDDNQAEKTPQVKMDFTEEKDKEDSSVKENDKEEASVEEVAEQPYDLKEEDVLSYIGKRYGRGN